MSGSEIIYGTHNNCISGWLDSRKAKWLMMSRPALHLSARYENELAAAENELAAELSAATELKELAAVRAFVRK